MSTAEYVALLEENSRLKAEIADDQPSLLRAQGILFNRHEYESIAVIRKKYVQLCQEISQWIDDTMGDAIYDQVALREPGFELKAAERLLSLTPVSGKEAFSEPGSDDFNIAAVIINFFRREVFEPELYGCLDEEVVNVFRTIEKNMAAAKYADKIFNREWHISTYVGIISDEGFPAIRAQRKEAILPSLVSMLLVLHPHPDMEHFEKSLGNLLDKAMSLAENIHGSLDTWDFVYSRYRDTIGQERYGPAGEFNAFHHLNVLGGGFKLKVDPGKDDRRYLLDIYPDLAGMSLETGAKADDIPGGTKGTILVVCQKDAIKAQHVFAPSVLKWLHDTVQLNYQRPARQLAGGL